MYYRYKYLYLSDQLENRIKELEKNINLNINNSSINSLQKNDYIWYFAYGSNSFEQLKKRLNICNNIERKPVKLKDWIRIFHGNSTRWNGSVASIKKKINSSVDGILFKLTIQQLINLFKFESGYRLKKFSGYEFGKNIKDIYTFIKEDDDLTQYKPNKNYLIAIAKLLKERKLLLGLTDITHIKIDYNDKNGNYIKKYIIK